MSKKIVVHRPLAVAQAQATGPLVNLNKSIQNKKASVFYFDFYFD